MVNHKMLKPVFDACTDIVLDREKFYGDKPVRFDFAMDFAKAKIQRVDMAATKEKKLDDILDTINYLAFAAIVLMDVKEI